MNERDNVQIVKESYAAFQRGDLDTLLSSLTEDVHWYVPGPPEVPYTGIRRGRSGVADFFRDLLQADEIRAFEPEAYFAHGDLVVVLGHYVARVKATGQPAETDWVHVFELRDGQIARWAEYYDTAEFAKAYRGNNRGMNSDIVLRDIAKLAARLTLGGTMFAHGAQKMFGAFGGPGLEGVAQFLDSIGFKPGDKFARANAIAEMTSGGLIALGALGPIGPAILVSVMLVAIETVHRPKGFWNTAGGYEMNIMLILLALLLATEDYGSLSFDAALGLRGKIGATFAWLTLAGGAAAAIALLNQRTIAAPQQQQSSTAETGETETPATVS